VGDPQELLVRQVADRDQRIGPRQEQNLGLIHVADPGDDRLVHDGFADRSRIVCAKAAQHFGLIHVFGQQVWPQAGQLKVTSQLVGREQLQDLGREANADDLRQFQHQGGLPPVLLPRLAGPVQMPGSVHAQVGVDRSLVVQVHQQMLAARFDRRERPAGQRTGREARIAGARSGDGAACQNGPQPCRGPKNRVAFGHIRSLSAAL